MSDDLNVRLAQELQGLALRRQVADLARSHLKDFEATNPELLDLRGRATEAKKDLETAEEATRETALALYQATAVKQVHPLVLVKIRRELYYELAEALAWAKTNAPAFLTLDQKPFGAFCMGAAVPPPCARIEEVPTATVAQDLSSLLIEGGGE